MSPSEGQTLPAADAFAARAHAGGAASTPASLPSAGESDKGREREARDTRLATLLAAAAAGDTAAFEAFYESTFAYARTVARRLLRDAAAIDDLLSDCYFEAWRCASRFDPHRGSPVTWLLTLVRSRGLDALRAAGARPDRVAGTAAEAGQAMEPEAAGMPAGADGEDPADRLWRLEAGAQLHAALATLDAAERWVLGLAYLRELSHAEIARCTGMPLGTVKSHALRAQRKLRALLSGNLLPRAHTPGPER